MMDAEKEKLYNEQKILLDTFLGTGAIDKRQYEKSLNSLKDKMYIQKEEKYHGSENK